LRGTNLGSADLTNARMARANAAGVSQYHATLENTGMREFRGRGAVLAGASRDGAKVPRSTDLPERARTLSGLAARG